MIFVVQGCPPRDFRPLVNELSRQAAAMPLAERPFVTVEYDVNRTGQFPTMLRALRWGAGDPVTLLEDDVDVCPGLVPFVCRTWRRARAGVVHWWRQGDLEAPPLPLRFEPFKHEICGNQCTTFAPEFLAELFAHRITRTWRERHRGDTVVERVAADLGVTRRVLTRSLVQHTGELSLVGGVHCKLRGWRLSRSWLGDQNIDPASLPLEAP